MSGPAAARFPIQIGRRSRGFLRLIFGVRPENAYVDMGDDLDAHFGYGRLRTPITNIRSWRLEGPWHWITAIGIRRSIRDGVFAFDGIHTGGVRLDFHERVPLLRLFRTPALYVTVADPDGFTAALSARGIPGEDVRRR